MVVHDVRPDHGNRLTTPEHDGRPRVLVVDDEPDLRLMLRLALRRDGRFDVCAEADNGQVALELAEEHQPDVVLLDLMMPVMDGWTALSRIQTVAPRSMVVVLSALDASGNAEATFADGAFAYLEKQVDPTAIGGELDLLLGQFRAAMAGDTVVAPSVISRASRLG